MDDKPQTAPSLEKEDRIVRWINIVWTVGFLSYIFFGYVFTDVNANATLNPRNHNTIYETDSYFLYTFIPRGFGQGGDNPGTLSLINQSGNVIAKWELPLIQMDDDIIYGNKRVLFDRIQ